MKGFLTEHILDKPMQSGQAEGEFTPFGRFIHGMTNHFRLSENRALRRIYAFVRSPLGVSLATTIIFFIIFLVVLRPGYETDDDLSIISLASGYLGGKPLPFLVYSNVLWGFLLNPLYALPSRINWEVLLFFVLNFISTTGLIYLVLSRPLRVVNKLFGILVILIADAFILMIINYTSMASFASISGFCILLDGVRDHSGMRKGQCFLGSGLVLAGSLIRIQSMLLALAVVLPPLLFCIRSFKFKNLILVLAVTGALVAGSYAFNRLYVRSSPEWNTYYLYNQTRSMLHDTPRLSNIETLYQKVGWSQNDLVMFTHWFFPDAKTYSLENLQQLINIIPDKRSSLFITPRILLDRLLHPQALPDMMMIVAIELAASVFGLGKRNQVLPFLALAAVFLLLGWFLVWSLKLPTRVLLSLLAAVSIDGLFLFDWTGLLEQPSVGSPLAGRSSGRYFGYCLWLLGFAAVGIVTVQGIQMSGVNRKEQTAYDQIMGDLKSLQAQGKIQENALIVSPESGIPIEWSDPMILELPEIEYLPMGWLTFSPAYESVLMQYGTGSLPSELYRTKNVYLLTHTNIMFGVLQFIREHAGISVSSNAIYKMPDISGSAAYDNVALYSFSQNGK